MLAAHSILLSCMGVPAIYYHSLLGSQNDYEGLEASGINRRINREKLAYSRIVEELETSPRRSAIFNGLKNMIAIRQKEKAFSPYASQTVLELGENVFGLKRENEETGDKVYFAVNVGVEPVKVDFGVPGMVILLDEGAEPMFSGAMELGAYEFVWAKES